MTPLIIVLIVLAAGLWVIGVPLVLYWLTITGRLQKSPAWRLQETARPGRAPAGWLQWAVAGWTAHTLAYAAFSALGVVLRALGLDIRNPAVAAIFVATFLLSVVALAREIHQKMPLG